MLRGQEAAFDPADWRRGFTREQIVDHLRECLEIVDELDPPGELAPLVFQVAQQMSSALEPSAEKLREMVAAQNGGIDPPVVVPTMRIPRG